MRYSPKYGLTQNWFMYQENTSFLSPYTRNNGEGEERSGKRVERSDKEEGEKGI
jgi:hypothetical protein